MCQPDRCSVRSNVTKYGYKPSCTNLPRLWLLCISASLLLLTCRISYGCCSAKEAIIGYCAVVLVLVLEEGEEWPSLFSVEVFISVPSALSEVITNNGDVSIIVFVFSSLLSVTDKDDGYFAFYCDCVWFVSITILLLLLLPFRLFARTLLEWDLDDNGKPSALWWLYA